MPVMAVTACKGPPPVLMMKAILGRAIGNRNGDKRIAVASASRPNGSAYGNHPAFPCDGAPPGAFSDNISAFAPDLDAVNTLILKRGIAPLPCDSVFAAEVTPLLPSGE